MQDGHRRSGISVRSLCASAIAVVAMGMFAAGCGGDEEQPAESAGGGQGNGGSLEGTTIRYLGFGGTTDEAMQKVWFQPFEEQTGAKVVLDSPTDYNKLKVQQQSNNVTYDLVDGDAFVMDPGCGDTWETLNVDMSAVLEQYKPKSECTAPDYIYSYVIAYSPEAFPDNPPRTCQDFFDTEKFPGRRQMWSYYYGGPPECAAVAAGADLTDPYPIDQDAAAQKLESIKGDIRIFDTSQQAIDAMTNNDVVMGIYTTRMILAANEAGAGWKIAEGWSSTGTGTFGIPKGAPNKAGAEALLKFIMDPQNNPKFAEELPAYGSVTKDTPPESASELETPLLNSGSREILEMGSIIDWDWWAQNDESFSQKWAAATTG